MTPMASENAEAFNSAYGHMLDMEIVGSLL